MIKKQQHSPFSNQKAWSHHQTIYWFWPSIVQVNLQLKLKELTQMKNFTFTLWRTFMNHFDSFLKSAESEISYLDTINISLVLAGDIIHPRFTRVVFVCVCVCFLSLQKCWVEGIYPSLVSIKNFFFFTNMLSSIQFSRSVIYGSLRPHGLQHIVHKCAEKYHFQLLPGILFKNVWFSK